MNDKIADNTIEAVLPLHGHDHARFALLRLTLDRFWNGGTIHVIVRPEDMLMTHAVLGQDHRFQLVNENLLLGNSMFRLPAGLSWQTQQILKLAASSLVKSDFYLTLDADCLLVRNVSRQGLVRNNRGLVGYDKSNHREAWYQASLRILDLTTSMPERSVSVTPFVLHTETVRALTDHMAILAQERKVPSWQVMLLHRRGWTEYTLYHLFAIAEGLWDAHHELEGSRLIGPSIWFKDDTEKWDASKAFGGKRQFYFVVVQSNTDIDPDWVKSRVTPYLL
jgi:hypothetical protein